MTRVQSYRPQQSCTTAPFKTIFVDFEVFQHGREVIRLKEFGSEKPLDPEKQQTKAHNWNNMDLFDLSHA